MNVYLRACDCAYRWMWSVGGEGVACEVRDSTSVVCGEDCCTTVDVTGDLL